MDYPQIPYFIIMFLNVPLLNNVNPGLINPVSGCEKLGGTISVSYCDYLEGTPTINKPWFSLIRG